MKKLVDEAPATILLSKHISCIAIDKLLIVMEFYSASLS
jgi:hypothetical protein